MKIKNLFFITMLAISSVAVYAQSAEAFRQPYSLGEKISPNPNFTGEVWLAPLSEHRELNVPMFNVTFAPGCRNSWHSHKAGQLLIATAGIGYYQEKGQPARRLFPGDIVEIAPMWNIGMGQHRTVGLPTSPSLPIRRTMLLCGSLR